MPKRKSPPLYRFLDLSMSHLPQREAQAITQAPPRVIEHEFGAWVNVQHDDAEEVDKEFAADGDFPVLHSVVKYARSLGRDVWWINFDVDAEPDDNLPTHDW